MQLLQQCESLSVKFTIEAKVLDFFPSMGDKYILKNEKSFLKSPNI